MIGLAPFIRRQPAYDTVCEACKSAIEEVRAKVPREQFERFCNPLNYLGASQATRHDAKSALIGRST